MARWRPNSPERLASAALELFEEHGYDNTTVHEITERAGLTKSSFFRHFANKREVLFDGETLSRVLLDGITDAPEDLTAHDALTRAFSGIGRAIFTPERRGFTARRATVIACTPELREREALKQLGLLDGMVDALEKRGVPDLEARVTAALGALAFTIAYERWLEPSATDDFDELVTRAISDVRAASTPD